MSKGRIPKHRLVRRDGGNAFLPDPASGTFIGVPDSEAAAEEFIATITSGTSFVDDVRLGPSLVDFGGAFADEDDGEELGLFDGRLGSGQIG